MNLIMYCVTMLSTLCVVILQFNGSFWIGLAFFYLSAGFFTVFFTTSFMELSHQLLHLKTCICYTQRMLQYGYISMLHIIFHIIVIFGKKDFLSILCNLWIHTAPVLQYLTYPCFLNTPVFSACPVLHSPIPEPEEPLPYQVSLVCSLLLLP